LRQKERRLQVRRQRLVPIFLGEILSWRQQLHSGVVNENMQVAEVLDDVIDELAQRGDAAQIDRIRFGASALRFGRPYDSLSGACLRGATGMSAPASASASTIERPMPRPPPVTSATFRERLNLFTGAPPLLPMLRRRRLCGAGDESPAVLPLTV